MKRSASLPVLALFLLAACGGGGGGSSVPAPPTGSQPTATVIAPANLTPGLRGVIAVSATASDDVAVTGVEFQIDGVTLGAIDTTEPYGVEVDTGLYASGQHILRARASDAAGNVSPWSTVRVQFCCNVSHPGGFVQDEAWITGLVNATSFAQAPDGRIFVTQQEGAIRVIKDGALLPTPFATVPVESVAERGLLGIALHPDFASNGYVYIYSTRTDGGSHNRVSRLTAAGDVASGGEVTLVDLPGLSSKTLHNGGGMHFGSDGKLYVGVGDNGDSAAAQDLSNPFGKLLRFNDDGTIPTDNPFYDTQTGLARAVWAYGLRNPFTFAVQPGTGTIYINDVGQDAWEEINVGAAGANYGWPNVEGPNNLVSGFVSTAPLFTYPHDPPNPPGTGPGGFITGSAVVGGAFYPADGPFPPGYRDQYYFADFIGKFVARIDAANDNAVYTFALLSAAPVDLMTGIDGALHVLTRQGIVRIRAS